MNKHINYICDRIEILNPIHSKKIKKNTAFFLDGYDELADAFFEKYIPVLEAENKTLDYAIDCYLRMLADVSTETIDFMRTGKYASTTFAEVNNRVYANPAIMEYYMHGLLMSQFLLKHRYQMFTWFADRLPRYAETTKSYLEVGAGHGLYLAQALEILDPDTLFTVVDISETSIEFSRNFTHDSRVTFNLKDIFDFSNDKKYDFITLGEVLEHVEDPLSLLLKLNDLLSDDGVLFLTTPTNAPAIDHIYLFNNVDEIRGLIKAAGFTIDAEMCFLGDDVSPEKAEKYKIAVLYEAFLKKSLSSVLS
jgi:2-polyprenyl-3-methyl-5-hydroxy-6-metoxy-1,4-benzoquinol methylase